MHRKLMPAIVSVIASVLLLTSLCLLFSLHPTNTSAATPKIIVHLTFPVATVTSSIPNAAQLASGLDPAIIAALIGLAGVIIGALIAGAFAVYQMRRNIRIQLEVERYRKELEVQYKAKEQEEQREETKAKAYRLALHADPRISRIQILDMSRPLDIASIYVRVRVHQDVRPGYEIDKTLLEAEAEHDPNALLQAGFKRLESRVSSAIDPDEAIRKYKRCVFVGDPGAGKTTLLKYLTLKSADNLLTDLPNLPIRIELNAFAGSGFQDLLDFAAAEWEVDYGFPKIDARSYMEENLLAGKGLLLLDALDETVIGETFETAEDSYQRVADAIIQAATRYHQSPMVVTARKAGYQQRAQLVGFTELEVLDFRFEEMQQFITNWFNCYEDPQKRANAADLNTKLQRNPRIQALAANPLLLSLIVLVYEAQLDLPDHRAQMYKECVETLLTKWDAKRNIRRRREFKPEHKRQLLTELAWHFHLQGRRYFPESEVLEVIADFLPKVRLLPEQNGQVLAEIANEQGLLKEQARGWQGFLHLTLQEYFVAQYVTDHQHLEALLTHCGDPWWEEVILLYAGNTPDASLLLRKLLGQDKQERQNQQDDLFHTNLILAGRCLAGRPTIQQLTLWETIINLLFESLTETPYSLTGEHIAEALAAIGSTDVNTRLLLILSNEQFSWSVRRSIARALGTLGERSIAPDLVHLLSNEQLDSSVRVDIAKSLGILANDEESVRAMATLLLTSYRADDIHRVLWTASHRAGVRIYIIEGVQGEKQVELVKL